MKFEQAFSFTSFTDVTSGKIWFNAFLERYFAYFSFTRLQTWGIRAFIQSDLQTTPFCTLVLGLFWT